MTRILPVALMMLSAVAPTAGVTGYASRYDPDVFEAVVDYRDINGWWRNAPPVDRHLVAGYAATSDCGQVGRVVYMRPVGSSVWERVLVADCAGRDSHQWMLDNNIVAELDYGLFTRWADIHGLPLAVEMKPLEPDTG